MSIFFLLSLYALSKTSGTLLSKSREGGQPLLVPHSGAHAFDIPPFSMMLSTDVVYITSVTKGSCALSKSFPASTEMIMLLLPFCLPACFVIT